MKKRQIIATLIEIADDLDLQKMYNEADIMTKIATTVVADWQGDPDYNPGDYGADTNMLGEEDYLAQQNLMNSVGADRYNQSIRDHVFNGGDGQDIPDEIPYQIPPRQKAEDFRRQLERAKTPHKPLDIKIDPSLIGQDDRWN